MHEKAISPEINSVHAPVELLTAIIDKPIAVRRPKSELTAYQRGNDDRPQETTVAPMMEVPETTPKNVMELDIEPQALPEDEAVSSEAIPEPEGVLAALPMSEMNDEITRPVEPEILVSEAAETVYERLIAINNTEGLRKEQAIFQDAAYPEAETAEDIIVNDFEIWLDVQAVSEGPVTIEAVQEGIDERSLDETLVQLVAYLKEAIDDHETDIIRESIQILGEELVRPHVKLTETMEHKQPLTPEMTQRLLTLLKIIGYQNPSEVLVAFVTRYDIEFLLQAIRYLSQLANSDYRQEFLLSPRMTRPTMMISENSLIQAGKRIFRLLVKRPETIEVPIAS